MAHFWVKDDSGEWAVFSPSKRFLSLPAGLLCGSGPVERRSSEANLVRAGGDNAPWILVTNSRSVLLNGVPLVTGMRVLLDRDEIRAGAACPIFFSSEELATVVEFPGSEKPVFCPRCKLEIASGSKAVKCPQCAVWHHQGDDLACWTYAQHCALCDQSTELNGRYRWSPDDL
jgi:hypothetical protein